MKRPSGWRIAANLATLANGLCGLGAIAWTLAGNPLFALFLILAGIGWDGLDGTFSRRSRQPGSTFGRVADSVSDAITFALAPAVIVAVHSFEAPTWAPYQLVAYAVGGEVAILALARLVRYTTVAYQSDSFMGVPTPQNALLFLFLVPLIDMPAYLAAEPLIFLGTVGLLAPLMVLPIPYPKVRRGTPARPLLSVLGLVAAIALIEENLISRLGLGLTGVELGFALSALGLALLGAYYVAGPFSVTRTPDRHTTARSEHA